MTAKLSTIVSLSITLAFVSLVESKIINFDPKDGNLFLTDTFIQKERKLSCDSVNTEVLNLDSAGLHTLPKGFVKSPTIKTILLSNNRIQKIPRDAFDGVPDLRCLDLSGNDLQVYHLYNFSHNGLKTLIFNGHETKDENIVLRDGTSLPSANFPNVESLSLSSVDYDYSALYSLFPKLRTIYWSDGGLRYLREDVVSHLGSDLTSIHLENNSLTKVRLGYLENVEQLYLDDNPLTSFEIYGDHKLRLLSMANCGYWDSWGLWNSKMHTLQSLDLSGNGMDERSLETTFFFDMINLENFDLSRNRFESIPNLELFPQIRKLNLNYNRIKTIDLVTTVDTLTMLFLRGNEIRCVDPIAFSKMPSLIALDLSENQLALLPDGLGRTLPQLQYLDLRANEFKQVTDLGVKSITGLTHLFIARNKIWGINETELSYFPKDCMVFVG